MLLQKSVAIHHGGCPHVIGLGMSGKKHKGHVTITCWCLFNHCLFRWLPVQIKVLNQNPFKNWYFQPFSTNYPVGGCSCCLISTFNVPASLNAGSDPTSSDCPPCTAKHKSPTFRRFFSSSCRSRPVMAELRLPWILVLKHVLWKIMETCTVPKSQ